MNLNVYKYKTRDLKLVSNKIVLILVFLLSFQHSFSQNDDVEIISHKVALGETVLTISKKYLVPPSEIYKLNKTAVEGISEGMLLYIPQPITSQEILAERKEKREKEKLALLERKKEREAREEAEKLAEAKEKELVASKESEDVTNDPEYGRREAISKLSISDKKQFIDHHVASGETLNSLSKKYGVSVEEIEQENEKALKKGLQAGSVLKMPVAKNLFIQKESDEHLATANKPEVAKTEVNHKVSAGETLYSISKKYGVTVDEITKDNANLLKNGLQSGQTLKIKTAKSATAVDTSDTITASTKMNEIPAESLNAEDVTIIKHHVEAKETLYSISKKYNVSIDEIKQQNEALLSKGLQSGQEILIKVKK